MDPDVVRAKLESLARCVFRIEAKTPATKEALASDLDAQDIIAPNLERAVQLCVDLGSRVRHRNDAPRRFQGFCRCVYEYIILNALLGVTIV